MKTLACITLATLSLVACRSRAPQAASTNKEANAPADHDLDVIKNTWVDCYNEVRGDGRPGQSLCLTVVGNQIFLDFLIGADPYSFGIGEPIVADVGDVRGRYFTVLSNDGHSLALERDIYDKKADNTYVHHLSTKYVFNLVPGATRASDKITKIYTNTDFYQRPTPLVEATNEYIRQ